jgi:flagellar hook-associated protein 1
MAGLSQLLNTARDALGAQSYGLNVTGQNVSNASTPGYVRREALLETQALGTQTTGSVHALGLRRVTDDFIERRQFEAIGLSSAASEHDQQLASVEALFNDAAGTGLGSALDAVFASFSALAANPNDTTTRQNVIAAAAGFSQSVNATADTLAQGREDLRQQAAETVSEINDRAQDIAKLNLQIAAATAQGQDAADLRDQRNQKLLDLSGLVDTRTFTDGAGNLVVQAAGTTLVEGQTARSFSLDLNSDGSLKLLASRSGGPANEVTQFLTGGKLAGIREARDVDIFNVSKQLDQFVFDVAGAVNAQHAAGVGQDGGTGRNLFDVSSTVDGAARSLQVSSAVLGHPETIAAAGSASGLPGGSDNAVLLSTLADRAIATGGTRTAAQAYGDIVGAVGEARASSTRTLETQQAISSQVQAMHEAMSGVSLDEEMVSLTKYQNAYQAAGKVLATVNQLLADLLNMVQP